MRDSVTRLLALVVGAIGLSGLPWGTAQADSPIWAPPALSQLIEEGLALNKEIQSLKARVDSLQEEIPFAGSLEDPRLGVAMLNLPTNSFEFDQEPMTQKQIFLAQKIPWFGKLSLREKRQALMAARQQALLEAKRLELARNIASAYYELGFVSDSLEINRRLTDRVSQILRVAETRYSAGEGLQQDVLQAQVELSELLNEKIVLEKKHRTLQDRINELINRDQFAPVTPPQDLDLPDLRLDAKILQARSLRDNPALWARQAEVDQAAVETELAKKEYWPDLDLTVAYGQREEDFTGRDLPDLVTASVVVNVPLWFKTRQNKKLAAALKNLDSAERSYMNLKESLPHRVDALVTEIQDTQDNYRLFTDALLLQSEQWSTASMTAYVVGKVDFDTMIKAQIRLLRFELQAKRYLFNVYQKRAELEEVVGSAAIPQSP